MAKIVASVIVILCLVALIKRSSGGEGINTGDKCECAGFTNEEIALGEQPLISMNPLNTTCDVAGEIICKVMCLDLAKLSKGKGPEMLCTHLKHAVNLKPAMFTRVCEKDWHYAGLTLEDPICCHNGNIVECIVEDEE